MENKLTRGIHVKLAAKGAERFYTVWVPDGTNVESVRGILTADFPITRLRVGDWYPQMVYRCTQLCPWMVTNGLGRDDDSIDIML